MSESKDFVREIIDRDLEEGRHDQVITRFPPEPNGYPHIGHAKSIVLNFELAKEYGGRCHLRFDDTNPETESQEYVDSIKEAVRWLGYDWGEHLYFASDYFEQFYEYALKLIKQGDAYVDSLDQETMREYRGTANEPGKPSPYRDRSVEENLDLFKAMEAGEFEEGEHVLRARIDMTHDHLLMRDPLLFRIRHREHYRRGDEWCIYPMYDFAHPLEDAIEDITHSLCTLEFDTHREVYDWVMEHCLEQEELPSRPRQYEFSRLNLGYTVMSKTKLGQLIDDGLVEGWDDPRLPSIAGMRRRGVPPASIRNFINDIGITRSQGRIQISRFEHALRDELETTAMRVNGVTDPLKVEIMNFPEGETDWINAPHWPENIDRDEFREIPFSKHLYIDRDDFCEDPPEEFIRLAPGRNVRLRYGYIITCEDVVRDASGEIEKIRCTYDPDTRGGLAVDGDAPDGTIHWVSADHAIEVEIRCYDRLFEVPDPDEREEEFTSYINEDSLVARTGYVEPSIEEHSLDRRYQFERVGYFRRDRDASGFRARVFNQIVPLRDPWADEDAVDIEQKRREKEQEKERHRQRSMKHQKDPIEQLSEEEKEHMAWLVDVEVERETAIKVSGTETIRSFNAEAVRSQPSYADAISKRSLNDLRRIQKEHDLDEFSFTPEQFAEFVQLVEEGEISTGAVDQVLNDMVESGRDPEEIVEEEDLRQVGAREELLPVVDQVIEEHPDQVEEFLDGNEEVVNFFMGQVMQETRGKADPELTKELLHQQLSND